MKKKNKKKAKKKRKNAKAKKTNKYIFFTYLPEKRKQTIQEKF